MEENAIVKAAIFRSHFEAAQQMPVEERCAFYDAMFRYQFTGEMGDDLPPAIKWLMTAILPVLDKECEGKHGRPESAPGAEEIAAAKEELGSAKAVAERYGISERTVYAKLQTAKTAKTAKTPFCSDCKNAQTAKTAKTKEERRKKNEEGRMEEESAGAQATPAAAEPHSPSPSPNSVLFPQGQDAGEEKPKPKRAKPFVPPSVEEVAAYCKERRNGVDAQSFVAFYASKGWLVGKSKMRDWRQAVITWERRDRERNAARASPEYETWVAPPPPDISEEERAAIVEGLNGVFAKLQGKCIAKEARR